MPTGGFGFGSSGSTGGSSGGGSSRPRSSQPSQAATAAAKPDVQLVRLAARILRSPNLKSGQTRKVQKYFQGFTAQDIQDVARQAKLQSSDVERVASLGAERPGTYSVSQVAQTPLKILGASSQAALGTIAEGPQGGFRGLTGKEQYTGIRSVLQRAGKSQAEAQKIESGLPGYVRLPANIAIETAVDPATYVTGGVSAIDKAAGETFLRHVGETLGKEAAQNAAKKLTQGGIKALDPEARALADQLPSMVARHVNRLQGGIRFAGHKLPGSERLTGHSINSGFLRDVQKHTRTFSAARDLERTGQAYAGFENDVRTAFDTLGAGGTWADIWKAHVQKMTRGLDEAGQQRVMNALDVGGKVAHLTNPAEVEAARNLRQFEQMTFGKEVGQGVFRTPEEALKFRQEQVRTAGAPKVEAAQGAAQTATDEATRLRQIADQTREQVAVSARQGMFGPLASRQAAERAASAEADAVKAEQAATKARQTATQRAARVERNVAKVQNIEDYAADYGTAEAQKKLPGVFGPSGKLSKNTLPRELRDVPARDIVVGVPKNPKPGDEMLPRLIRRADAVDQTAPSAMELNAGKVFARRGAAAARNIHQVDFWQQMDEINARSRTPFMHNEADWTPEVQAAIKKSQVEGADHVILADGNKYVVQPRLNPAQGGGVVTEGKTLIRQELANDYKRVVKFTGGGPEVTGFAKGAQHAMNLWKAYATTLLPFGVPFTSRNALGNYINGYWLTGLNPVAGTNEARRLQSVLADSLKRTGDLSGIANAEDRRILDEAIKHRVIHAGFYTTDLGHPVEFRNSLNRALFDAKGSPLSQKFLPLAWGQRLNNWVEENARLGVFTQMQKKGFDAQAAARTVQKYLFDYADLSNMDESIKRFVPFWTWTRKNLPLQLETLVKTPGKITTQQHVIQGLRGESAPYDPLALQQYMKENEAVVGPFKIGGAPTAFMPDIPFTSTYQSLDPLAKILGVLKNNPNAWSELGRSGINASGVGGPLAGILPTLYQLAAGQEAFTQRKFKPGEKRLGLPAQLEFAAEQLAPFGPGLSKLRGVLDKNKRTGKLVGLTGVQNAQLTDTTRKNELFRRLAELTASTAGQKLPAGRYKSTSKKSGGGGSSSGSGFGFGGK